MDEPTPCPIGKLHLILGALCLLLTLSLIGVSFYNRSLQSKAQGLTADIANARAGRQITTNVVRDLAQVAGRDAEILNLLKTNGIDFKPSTEAAPAR